MTVAELIIYLQQLPSDVVVGVVFRACSDYTVLEASDLKLFPADKPVADQFSSSKRFVLRQGRIMEYNPRTWSKEEQPQFVSILAFPGN